MHWQTMVVCQRLRLDRFLFEVLWELSDDAFRQHVRHLEDFVVNLIVGGNIASPVCMQASRGFFQCKIHMKIIEHNNVDFLQMDILKKG